MKLFLYLLLCVVTPEEFGAVRDGVTDDTAAIQQAVDAASATGDTVQLTKGTYMVSSVNLPMESVIEGRGATLKLLPNQGEFVRIFTTQYTRGPNSVPIVIDRVVFDGNLENQGPYENYEKEHQAGIFVYGTQDDPVRMVVTNCTFNHWAGDGLAVHTDARVIARNIASHEVFRGNIVQGGHRSYLEVDGFRGTGVQWLPHIDHEPEGTDTATTTILRNCRGEPGLQVDTAIYGARSSFLLQDCVVTLPHLYGGHGGQKLRAVRCVFNNRAQGWIRTLGNAVFDDCDFVCTTENGYAANVFHNASDQLVRFRGCMFRAADGVAGVHGLRVNPHSTQFNNCRVIVEDCVFDKTLDKAFLLDRCGDVTIRGGQYNCPTFFYAVQTNPLNAYSIHVRLENVHADVQHMGLFVNYYASPEHDPLSSLTLINSTIPETTTPIQFRPGIDEPVVRPVRKYMIGE